MIVYVMKRTFLLVGIVIPLIVSAQSSSIVGRRSSTEAKLYQAVSRQQMVELPAVQLVDTLLTPHIPFTPMAVSMHGYSKRLGDAKESFILRNETHNYHISRVVLKIQYTTEDGTLIHSREECLECNLQPGSTQIVTIKSFDSNKSYYYYTMPPKRASGTPYRVQYDVLRYDIVVE